MSKLNEIQFVQMFQIGMLTLIIGKLWNETLLIGVGIVWILVTLISEFQRILKKY